jgi:hypothetical protein
LEDPGALTVITVLYDPVAKPLVCTLALMLSVSVVVVPLETFRPSHAAVSVSVHDNVPPDGFERMIDLANGDVPPATPEKLKLVGFNKILGVTVPVPPATTNVTGTDVTCVLFLLSLMAMRMVPLDVPAVMPLASTRTTI